MKFNKRFVVPLLALMVILSAIAAFRIAAIRHASVQLFWGVIEKLDDKRANEAILPATVKIKSDIPYIDDGSNGHLLDVYYPEHMSRQMPVIVYVHGGGFVAGDKKHTRQYCMTLAKQGYSVFNINYRLAPGYTNPAQITDVVAAMAWIAKNCPRYRGDKSRVVLAGDSAGAYLSAMAACICTNANLATALGITPPFTEKEIRGALLFSGLFDLDTVSTLGFPGINSDIEMFLGTSDIKNYKNLENFSVTGNVTEKFPPAFISSGEVDWLHPETVELIKALDRNNVHHEALLFDKTEKRANHDYQLNLNLSTAKKCMARVTEFLETVTR